jgi:sugar O-acyltransferase (sialic acid O-acetyltransferase NeuD family)
MRKLAILGASGHGKVVADTALLSRWDEVVFFDDAWPELEINGSWSVVGDTQDLLARVNEFSGVAVAIGNNRIRLAKLREFQKLDVSLPALIHPCACVADDAVLDDGTVIFAGAVVQPSSVIGVGCIVNTSATVDHDCVLAPGVHVCPGSHLAGGVKVGECSWIGIGSVVNQYLSLGTDVTVGAGAAVVNDLSDGLTVVGVPARSAPKE